MDIRVKKTKRAIQKAFVALLREKPIEKITVKEIAERAEINKTTFYSHYETLDGKRRLRLETRLRAQAAPPLASHQTIQFGAIPPVVRCSLRGSGS